ncbi:MULTISPECIES: hypothetical protein [unclassified Devosia]|uniref:hypothetical protein n=1 Tax=unclassified Devosia TaxID=196773 RepID=UPI000A7545BC|nr:MULTISPECIES: hypothetical protein [unclassified Devosia]
MMAQRPGLWDGRRRAVTLGMISNIIGAAAAAGAAVTAWLSTHWQTDLTQWTLVLAGIGGVFVVKGTIILGIAESRPYMPRETDADMQHSLRAFEGRLNSRQKAMVERLDKLEAEVSNIRVGS